MPLNVETKKKRTKKAHVLFNDNDNSVCRFQMWGILERTGRQFVNKQWAGQLGLQHLPGGGDAAGDSWGWLLLSWPGGGLGLRKLEDVKMLKT